MLPESCRVQMEKVIQQFGRQVESQVKIRRKVPLRSAIGKISQVYPVILFPIGNDIADMEVSMQASLGGRDAVQRLEKSPAVRFGDARRFLDPGTDDVLHIREDIGIGRNGMELPAKLGEFECQGFQLLRFLNIDIAEKAKTDAMDAMDKALGKN